MNLNIFMIGLVGFSILIVDTFGILGKCDDIWVLKLFISQHPQYKNILLGLQ
jgi:hypothetical protein